MVEYGYPYVGKAFKVDVTTDDTMVNNMKYVSTYNMHKLWSRIKGLHLIHCHVQQSQTLTPCILVSEVIQSHHTFPL